MSGGAILSFSRGRTPQGRSTRAEFSCAGYPQALLLRMKPAAIGQRLWAATRTQWSRPARARIPVDLLRTHRASLDSGPVTRLHPARGSWRRVMRVLRPQFRISAALHLPAKPRPKSPILRGMASSSRRTLRTQGNPPPCRHARPHPNENAKSYHVGHGRGSGSNYLPTTRKSLHQRECSHDTGPVFARFWKRAAPIAKSESFVGDINASRETVVTGSRSS